MALTAFSYYAVFQLITIATFTQTAQLPPTIKPLVMDREPTVRIQCLSGSMIITVKDPPLNTDGLFTGMIYPKGLSKNSSCLSEYRNHDGALKYKLPLRSCNTMPQENDDGGIEFFNTIVLQPHLKLVTDLGRGYHVRCRYKSREAATKPTIAAKLANPQAYTSDEIADRSQYGRSLDNADDSRNEIPMPGCHMKIFSGGSIAENVKIGDPLTLIVNIDKQDVYGLHVTDCLVRDGLGWGEQRLVGTDGCPTDGEIMGLFDYSSDRASAKVTFPAHKFPYTASVYYQCNVRLCALADPECQNAPACDSKRPKRQAEGKVEDDEGHPATIEVYSGLYVNENAEVIDGDDEVLKEKTPEDAICVSQRNFAIAIAVAGLILMLAVIAAVLIIMARRRGKTISNSGSSIYSGPYTNTAFSHSS
uniref:Putative conserved secreted protein n=1 Tax=Phlebotomus kandelakii TaxID=1109342 RepID=A0A6B2E8F3_9DIPT